MARKRTTEVEPSSQTTDSHSELPASDVNGHGEPNGSATQQNGQKPVHTIRVLVSKDTYVQAAIWERVVQAAGGTFTTYEVSVQKRWKDASGDWKSLHSFRASECYALEFVVRQAQDWILLKRIENNPL